MPAETGPLTPSALKARFKQRCGETNNVHQNWQIRIHRSLSWLARAIEFPADELEARFLFLWIALNSLYSRWDAATNAPEPDSTSRREFLSRLCADDPPTIKLLCHQHRPLLKRMLADPYLSATFWKSPDHPKAKGWATQDVNHLDHHFRDKQYAVVLTQAMDRLFILRGQIVHGASTRGSRHNRTALRTAVQLLEQLLPPIVQICIERRCGDDWPDLCYPPAT